MRSDYSDLINKIRITGSYIDKLDGIESEMKEDIECNRLEPKVKDILEKCMEDINQIYVKFVDCDTLQVNTIDDKDEIGDNK